MIYMKIDLFVVNIQNNVPFHLNDDVIVNVDLDVDVDFDLHDDYDDDDDDDEKPNDLLVPMDHSQVAYHLMKVIHAMIYLSFDSVGYQLVFYWVNILDS